MGAIAQRKMFIIGLGGCQLLTIVVRLPWLPFVHRMVRILFYDFVSRCGEMEDLMAVYAV